MKTIDKGTLTRTILLWLAILNQILTALNMNPLPLDDNTVSTVITTVFALWAWWKNNDFTYAAKKGTELTKSLKNGDSVQVVKASDADHEFTEGGE
ncbi:Phage holin [Lactococcus cremoris]|nr:Phage holin [Lactococcus cremoris]